MQRSRDAIKNDGPASTSKQRITQERHETKYEYRYCRKGKPVTPGDPLPIPAWRWRLSKPTLFFGKGYLQSHG
jgi:hypothetical protein